MHRPRRFCDRFSYRTYAATIGVAFALAGAAIGYVVPLAASHDDGWFAAHNGMMGSGLAIALATCYAAVTISNLLTQPRKAKRHARKLRQADRQRRVRTAPRGLPTRLGSDGGWSATLPTDLPESVHVRPDPQPRQQVPAWPRKQ